jgi:hypothetical protein
MLEHPGLMQLFGSNMTPSSTSNNQEGKAALMKAFKGQLARWKGLLRKFLREEDDQARVGLLLFMASSVPCP